jgi:tetratricopeptide (TPR) repeat protein
LADESPARAVRHFLKAVEIQSDFVEARFNLAATLARLNRCEEAVKQYDEVLRIRPDYAPAKANRDELVSQLAAGKSGTVQP